MIPKSGFKTKGELEFPNIVNVCVFVGECPCECVHCPVGVTPKSKRQQRFGSKEIEIGIFKKIVDELSLHKDSILRIHSVGEPILWKSLVPAVKYCQKKKAKNWIFTSLITQDKILLKNLAKNCSIIEVSINSTDKEDYKKTKGIDAFDLVLSNIKFISKFIKKERLKTRLIVSRVENEDKEKNFSFISFWKKSGISDDAFVRSYHNYNGVIDSKGKDNIRKIVPCLVHFARFNIDTKGDALICFNELFKHKSVPNGQVLGNLKENKINEIWQGDKLDMIRRAQLEGSYSSLNFKIPCKDCTFCQPFDTDRETSEKQLKQLENKKNHKMRSMEV